MENKKIGDIYKERLKNVETTPPEDVWENISAALDKKEQKRRVIPLWYKLAGIAAVVALLLGLFYENASTSTSSGAPSFTVPTQRKTYNFDPVSREFEKTMLRSSILLETLMANSENLPSNSGGRDIPEEKQPAAGALAKITTNPLVLNNDILNTAPLAIDNENLLYQEQLEETPQVPEFNEIEESLAENDRAEDFDKKEPLSRRFSVSTTAGAVYFDNLGSGNASGAGFGKGSKGEISMAYGVNLAYQVSEKVKIRTGLSKVELNQSAPDISYAAAMPLEEVDPNAESFAPPSPATGDLRQEMGFIEIPLEVEYSLINKKIGLNIIGGASTLVLDESMVSMASPYATTRIGEAQNLNNVSFSTNIGLGVEYHISEEFEVHLEPIFKYQLNTFDNTSGVNPYYFGIYSGLSFKF